MRLTLALLLLIATAAPAVDWAPVDPADLARTEPRLDPNAGAETIFWETWITDRALPVVDRRVGAGLQVVTEQYVRVKIYDERGVESESVIDLLTNPNAKIESLQARTIKPDGTILDVDKAEIFDRVTMRARGVRVRSRSFSMPNVAPGDIIEYRWKQFNNNAITNYQRLFVQRRTPSWKVSYHVKPLAEFERRGIPMQSQSFNCNHSGFAKENGGFFGTTLTDVPAYREEPDMPPDGQTRGWILLFYGPVNKLSPAEFWKQFGVQAYEADARRLRAEPAIVEAAQRLTAGAASDFEKIAAIRRFCLTEIKNVFHDRFGYSEEEQDGFRRQKTTAEVLAAGEGRSYDINTLFAALLNAVGLEARAARLAGRDQRFFEPTTVNEFLLTRYNIAVPIGEEWQFYDLSAPYLPEGMLPWPEEGVHALITDPKEPVWVRTPMSGPEQAQTKRRAQFKLRPDGSIEGTVGVELNGHESSRWKTALDSLPDDQRQAVIREQVTQRLPAAEVSDIEIFQLTDVDRNLVWRYKVRVPGYAQPTSKRLLLPANYFELNEKPRFTSSGRVHPVYFDYAWSEDDEVVFEFPEGFDMETPESPGGADFGPAGSYEAMLYRHTDGRLIYRRKFRFGANQQILFPVEAYPQIKAIFDHVHQKDGHMIVLREAAAEATAN